jgi:hypothetical protein
VHQLGRGLTADCGKNYEYCDRNLFGLEALIRTLLDSAGLFMSTRGAMTWPCASTCMETQLNEGSFLPHRKPTFLPLRKKRTAKHAASHNQVAERFCKPKV